MLVLLVTHILTRRYLAFHRFTCQDYCVFYQWSILLNFLSLYEFSSVPLHVNITPTLLPIKVTCRKGLADSRVIKLAIHGYTCSLQDVFLTTIHETSTLRPVQLAIDDSAFRFNCRLASLRNLDTLPVSCIFHVQRIASYLYIDTVKSS